MEKEQRGVCRQCVEGHTGQCHSAPSTVVRGCQLVICKQEQEQENLIQRRPSSEIAANAK